MIRIILRSKSGSIRICASQIQIYTQFPMSFVQLVNLPSPDPLGGFVLPGKDVLWAVQPVEKANLVLDGKETCPLTLEPLQELERLGVVLWARQTNTLRDKQVCWEFLCRDELQTDTQNTRLHVFDYEMCKGLLQSRKDFFKCPLCFRGASETEKIDQEDAEFVENLLAKRKDCLSIPDLQMALYWEKQVVRQFLSHYEQEKHHQETVVDIVRSWSPDVANTSMSEWMEQVIARDLVELFGELYAARSELSESEWSGRLMEQACEHQAVEIVEFLVAKNTFVSKRAFQSLIAAQNEYLLDMTLEFYSRWMRSAKPEQLLSSRDWTDLGMYCVVHELPFFIKAVQRAGVFRLKSRLKMDPRVDDRKLVELGLVLEGSSDHEQMMDEYDDKEWGDEDEDEDDWDSDDE